MTRAQSLSVLLAALLTVPLVHGQVKESAIEKHVANLRSVPTDQRPDTIIKIAQENAMLPAGLPKVQEADSLAHLATEADPSQEAVAVAAQVLATSLRQNPLTADGDQVPEPYMELAKITRYEGVSVTFTFDSPLYIKANQILAANEADIQKPDFTLEDLHNKKVTLSDLRGNIVLVNFWATSCPLCRNEMSTLAAIYSRFGEDGIVILSITDEDASKVDLFVSPWGYRPPVLIDSDDAVHKMFHVESVPCTFVFDSNGKLVAEAMDERTQRQFMAMIAKAVPRR